MDIIIEFLKAVILGVIQGITEWLPVSSTGHMILFDSFWPMDQSKFTGGRAFVDLFLVVIQFGSILAVLAEPLFTPENTGGKASDLFSVAESNFCHHSGHGAGTAV